MAKNLHAVIWTRITGTPQKMGDLVLGEQQIVFTYTDHYHQSELAGLSLLGDQQLWDEKSVHYPVSERVPLFPRLISLVPGKTLATCRGNSTSIFFVKRWGESLHKISKQSGN